jgi:hypothetical protein
VFDDECCSSQYFTMLNVTVSQDDTSLATNNLDEYIHRSTDVLSEVGQLHAEI